MSVRAVIFDLDGTITAPFFDFDAMRKEMGLPADAGPIWEAMAAMGPEQRRRTEAVLNFHEQKAVEESQLNDGAEETLRQLRARGIYVGVLTRNRRSNALAVAKKHGLMFDEVVGREEGPLKPDAFGVLKLCERFGVEPRQSLMVGDYLFDLLCAKAAGAVAVLLANRKDAEKFVEHADYTIDRIDQVLDIVENHKATG